MLTLNASQRTAIALESKIVKWAFTITDKNAVVYTYASGSISGFSNNIVLNNFSGIELRRNMAENKVIAPSDVSFTISNKDNVMLFTDFKGGSVLIDLYISTSVLDTKMGSWLFRIKTANPGYQDLDIVAEDFLQYYLEGYYPNTRAPEDIFPSNRTYTNKALCVPVPFGTAYIPLRDVFITDAGYIMLGDPALTYTITKLRSPRSEGSKIEWDSGTYSFTQSTKADADAVNWRVFQAIIADINNDGTPDAHGCWLATGGNTQDPLVRLTRSDTATMTSPADVISFVLQDMGIPAAKIDIAGTFATAKTTYAGWGLTFNGAFWYKQKREAVLAQLLTMCHSCLDVSDKIQLRVLSKTSKKTITAAEVLRTVDQGEGTFIYQDVINTDLSDSGYVAYQPAGEAQDELIKVLVGIDGASTVVSSSVVECPFVQDSQNVKRIGTLHLQRLLGKEAQIGYTAKSTCFGLQPDDVITMSAGNYGGTYDVLIDSIKITPDLSLPITCSKYKVAFDDWGDLSPGALAIPADTTVSSWKPVMSGPDADTTSGTPSNILPGRLRIGETSSYVLIEPDTPLRVSVYAGGVEKARFGNLNGFLDYVSALYGLAAGDLTSYIKIDPTNGVVISGALTAGAGSSIAGAYIISLGVDKLTAGTITSKAITLALTPGGGDVKIQAGKTDFGDTTSGFILGIDDSDSDKPKFEMGDATKYINMSDGVITLSNGLVTTPAVADDNITRVWNYNSDTQIAIGTDVYTPSILSYTEPFLATNDPILLFSHSELYFTPVTSDTFYFEFYIMRSILVVLDGVFKWTKNGATNEYYLTNEAGGSPGIPALNVGNESILEDDVGGNGSYLTHNSGALNASEYDWGDRNTLGFNTLYVRLSDSTTPDTKPDGYISAGIFLHTVRTGYFNEYLDDGSDAGYLPFDFHLVDPTPGNFTIYYHVSSAGVVIVGSYPATSYSLLNILSCLERKK